MMADSGKPGRVAGVLHLNRRALDRPAANEPRLAGTDDLTRQAAPEGKGPAGQLHPGLDLPHDLDGLTRLIVQTQEEGLRAPAPGRSPVLRGAEQLLQIERPRERLAQTAQGLQVRAQ